MQQICPSAELVTGLSCELLASNTGWTWTLTTRLGELLAEAENRYGPRDRNWTPIGIEFGGDGPGIWYPGDRRHVSIRLSAAARQDLSQAIFQLSHEVIHLLGPSGGKSAPAIEEGLATLFSEEVSKRFNVNLIYNDPAYLHCRNVALEFLGRYPEGVKQVRQIEKSFHLFDPPLLRRVFADIPDKLAADVCEPFDEIKARLNATAPHPDAPTCKA
jgi:hypothetical protein